ncbi:lytic transglycosylase domain-containing protein [Sandaracinobacteroides saxicola]|uniref:Lytic transglycosylase domain-containing protein n=1 Tax=Sandaracinobacteroides saxicola TaxID=2759707 RepID=A0A7G5IGC0_9SPHN|nr:lytic transglycosylase domain-containing protein [Sandaracinobacteroides saxicola]QMW22412.1 lytic transglycosylase domain-containing protein [Sandaracinobacteroides saxicola]
MIRALLLSLLLATAADAAPRAMLLSAAESATRLGVDDSVTGVPGLPLRAAERKVPAQLTPAQRFQYRRLFLDIDAGRFSAARAALAAMPQGPLHAAAQAQILLGLGAGAGQTALIDWLNANPAAPQASAIAALARRAGAAELPALASRRQLVPVRLTPSLGPRSARGDLPGDATFAASARALLAADRIAELETALEAHAGTLSSGVAAEWAQRAAWDRYLDGDDAAAMRLGDRAAAGTGDWAVMGNWVAGLAAFRQNDCEGSARRFDAIGRQFASADMASAAAYWAARSHLRCGRPDQSAARLAIAARDTTGFYGLLATRALGIEPRLDWREPDFINADWNHLSDLPGARRAAALVEIGQLGLADRELRQLAMISPPATYEPLLRLAARLDLPATQYWLAQNPPPGQMAPLSARLPAPDWRPFGGWRVDRNLVFAHALQESGFIMSATSRTGARGALQLMPGTARDMARAAEMQHDETMLTDPSFNVEYGQRFLELLRDTPQTQGLLPKAIAAYNAGHGNVGKWNQGGVRDNGDVLLFIESIPFRETRHYVEVVFRNYWLYSIRATGKAPSLDAIAANLWPTFPGRPGPAAVATPPVVVNALSLTTTVASATP